MVRGVLLIYGIKRGIIRGWALLMVRVLNKCYKPIERDEMEVDVF